MLEMLGVVYCIKLGVEMDVYFKEVILIYISGSKVIIILVILMYRM